MVVKPGYKQTEVGVIPEEWAVLPLAANVQQHNSGIYKNSAQYGKGCNIVGVSDIYDIDCVDGQRFAEVPLTEKERAKCSLRGNDLLYGESSLVREGIARTVYVTDRGAGTAFAWHTRRYSVKQDALSSEYLYYYLQSRIARAHMMNQCIQTALTGINTFAYFSCPILIPRLPEQRAIATALSNVDGLLGGLDRLIAKKRDLKQAAMQQLLTGQTRLPGFHGEWEVKRLGDVGKCLRGVNYKGNSDLSTHDTPHTKRLLRSNNVQNAIVVTGEVQFVNAVRVSSHQILQQDDILICMANGSKALVGKAGIFMVSDGHEYTFGAFMGCFRTNYSEANPAFVFYLFLTSRYRDYINNLLVGSSINNLRPSSIESLEFPTPPLTEQTAIAEVLRDMDTELAALEQRREKTCALKQGMMQELLTGRIRLV